MKTEENSEAVLEGSYKRKLERRDSAFKNRNKRSKGTGGNKVGEVTHG